MNDKDLDTLRNRAEEALQDPEQRSTPQPAQPHAVDELLEELQVYQMELEIQNQELREAQVESERERSKYYALFYALPVAGFVIDKDGVVTQYNHLAEGLFSKEQSKHIRGMGLMRLFEQPGRAWLHQQLSKHHNGFSIASQTLDLAYESTTQYRVFFTPIFSGTDVEQEYLLLLMEA